MAQRKAKEPLLAEIPRPRLSDEELMELFYSGKRKEAPQQKAEDDLSRSAEAALGLIPEETPSQTARKGNAQARQAGDLNKGSSKEPSLEEPFSEMPSEEQDVEEPRNEIEEAAEDEPSKIRGKVSEGTDAPITDFQAQVVHNKGSYKEPYYEKPSLEEPSLQKPSSQTHSYEVPFASQPDNSFTTRPVADTFRTAFEILPTLAPLDQLLYLWFLNLSHAVGRESCRATMALLQRATGVSEKLVRETLRSLLGRGYLRLLDGGAAGRAALYHVAHPREVLEKGIEGSPQKPSLEEPSRGKVPHRNLPRHIERESIYITLSQKEPFSGEGSLQEGSLQEGSQGGGVSNEAVLASGYPPALTDTVIDRFYSMTGQLRISRQKRERSRTQLLDLLRQGFRIDDVLYAIDWVSDHISAPIHSFGIIPEIIGQALGRREENRSDKQRPPATPLPPSEEGQQEHEQAKLAEIQASLAPEALATLQQEATQLVEKEYGPQVPGRNTLIRIKLTELLRERYLKPGSSGENNT